MKHINYHGQGIPVSDEVAEFLEQDRLRENAQQKRDQRHLSFAGNDIYAIPSLFSDTPTDPTFAQALSLLRKHKLREIFPTLPDDDRKLLWLYYFRCCTMEQIGAEFGVSKMAISKRLRKLLGHLRSLMDETPQIFSQKWFTIRPPASYQVRL